MEWWTEGGIKHPQLYLWMIKKPGITGIQSLLQTPCNVLFVLPSSVPSIQVSEAAELTSA